jgi:hypothetical protein
MESWRADPLYGMIFGFQLVDKNSGSTPLAYKQFVGARHILGDSIGRRGYAEFRDLLPI